MDATEVSKAEREDRKQAWNLFGKSILLWSFAGLTINVVASFAVASNHSQVFGTLLIGLESGLVNAILSPLLALPVPWANSFGFGPREDWPKLGRLTTIIAIVSAVAISGLNILIGNIGLRPGAIPGQRFVRFLILWGIDLFCFVAAVTGIVCWVLYARVRMRVKLVC